MGSRTTVSGIAQQFGFAMMPSLSRMSSPLTSGTTSGTFCFMRHAELLSMTSAPDSTADGPWRRDTSAPALNSATSMPWKESSASGSTGTTCPLQRTCMPYEDYAAALRSARARALTELGLDVRWIFDIMRSLPELSERRYWADYTLEVAIASHAQSDGC